MADIAVLVVPRTQVLSGARPTFGVDAAVEGLIGTVVGLDREGEAFRRAASAARAAGIAQRVEDSSLQLHPIYRARR